MIFMSRDVGQIGLKFNYRMLEAEPMNRDRRRRLHIRNVALAGIDDAAFNYSPFSMG